MKTRNINILFLGGGKRVSLANRFVEAGCKLNKIVKTFSYELDYQQPISVVSEIIKGKRWADPQIIDHLSMVLNEFEIDLVISNVDPALPIHAELAKKHSAARFVCAPEIISNCFSKKLFQSECEKLGLPVIPRWDGEVFPALIKPDFGSASKGILKIENRAEMEEVISRVAEEFLLQKFIAGEEYTVDAYVSYNNEICGISPRIRKETLGGESVVSEIVNSEELLRLSSNAIKHLKLRGPITLQFMKESDTDQIFLMEVNTRFGGGVICSIEAGFDFPLMLLQDVIGLPVTKVSEGRQIIMKRYFKEAFYAVNH